MKVLLISAKSPKSHGGIAVWTDGFLEACVSENIDIDIVNTVAIGSRLDNANSRRNIFDEYKRTKRILSDLKMRLKCPSNYDVVHLNTSCGTFGIIRDLFAARCIKRKKVPLITHYHCDIPYWIRTFYSKYILRKLAKLSDKNIVLCENSKKYLENECGIIADIVPNFVDERLVITNPKHISHELKKAVFVGRISEAKGAVELFELAIRFPQITFELIGEVSDNLLQVTKPDNIVLMDAMAHEELIERLDLADLFVFPSHSEGFSVALTEAMARGLPCVATDVGANGDMLSDDCGCVVPIGDVDAMEDAIKMLISYEKREQMSKNTIEKVKGSYLVDSVVAGIKELYMSVQQ